jgi:hypothetical protein
MAGHDVHAGCVRIQALLPSDVRRLDEIRQFFFPWQYLKIGYVKTKNKIIGELASCEHYQRLSSFSKLSYA